MTTIQLTLDDPLLQQLDRAALEANLPLGVFIQRTLTTEIERRRVRRLESRERESYRRLPSDPDDPVEDWESLQEWGDD
jgi:hypothetical protein